MIFELGNPQHYFPSCFKIKTKSQGLQPFRLRKIQLKYIQHLKDDFPDGIIRSISLKPRQAGWSTLIAGINAHRMCTRESYRGIVVADKFSRTQAVHSIYTTLIDNLPDEVKPMIAKRNDSEVLLDNPDPSKRDKFPGLGSGFLAETAQDEDAGKSSSRQFAHLSEYAFYPYAMELDQSVQNSIPLAKGTAIFKESTANGMAGDGESFYVQWMAAERGESLYKPFFVSWYEIDDYAMEVPRGFILTSDEVDLVKHCPGITNANLVWRRMKMREIHTSSESGLTPEELFCQDFPSWPEQAFLSSGRPIFDMEQLKKDIAKLRAAPPEIKAIRITQPNLSMYPKCLTVFKIPEKGIKYVIGADIAEGLEAGDSSSAKIIDSNMNEVAIFHGKIDPDRFGRCLVELAKIYNNALIVPEINNMGHTTLEAIKQMGYMRVYMRSIQDELEQSKETAKMGWRTTSSNKQKILNALVAAYRDGEIKIVDINLLREMTMLTREENGNVSLNSRDRVVAVCLAIEGLKQSYEPAIVYTPGKPERLLFETKDISREKILKRRPE